MANTYKNPEDHRYNVVQDMGKLNSDLQELFDSLDRLKVSTGVQKEKVETIKSKVQQIINEGLGKESGPIRINDDDLSRAIMVITDMAKGKRDHLLFCRLADGTIMEKFSKLVIRIE